MRQHRMLQPPTRSTSKIVRPNTMMLSPTCGRLGGRIFLFLALLECAVDALSSSYVSPNKPSTFRVMSYNIHAFRDSEHVDNFDRVVEAINLVKPDICCLNEVLHPYVAPAGPGAGKYFQTVKDGKGRDMPLPLDHIPQSLEDTYLSILTRETGLCNYEYGAASDTCYFGRVPFGNAILTKLPIMSCTHIPLEVEEGDVELGYQERSFVDPRQAIFATVELSDIVGKGKGNVGVCTAHLDQVSEDLRGKQTSKVVDAASDYLPQDCPQIICGDFNSFRHADMNEHGWRQLSNLYDSRGWGKPNEESLVLNVFEKGGYFDTFSFEGGQYPEPTCWTNNPVMRIDHILTKQPVMREGGYDINPLLHRRVDVDGSDHFPIYADFEIIHC